MASSQSVESKRVGEVEMEGEEGDKNGGRMHSKNGMVDLFLNDSFLDLSYGGL